MSKKHHNSILIEEYLLNQCNILNSYYYNKYPKKWNPNSNHCAVIIEPRSDHILLEAVCKNVMYFLPSNWNLVVYSYDKELVMKRLTNMEFLFYNTDKPSYTLEEYSYLMMSSSFWENIPAENIIIFQTDSYITRKMSDEYLRNIEYYPMVGAPFRIIYQQFENTDTQHLLSVDGIMNYSMSGGFSFRRKSAMLDCIYNVSLSDIIEYRKSKNYIINSKNINYEDFYYENALFLLNYKFPSFDTCLQWCSQVLYNIVKTHAIHGFYNDYVYNSLVYILYPPLFDLRDELIYFQCPT